MEHVYQELPTREDFTLMHTYYPTPQLSASRFPPQNLEASDNGTHIHKCLDLSQCNRTPLLPPDELARDETDNYTRENYEMWETTFERGVDPDLSKGPVMNRSHTDILFLILFFVAVVAYLILSICSIAKGNLHNFMVASDYKGRKCGIDKAVRAYPLVYWPSKALPPNASPFVLPSSHVVAVCTNACPDSFAINRSLACSDDATRNNYCSWYGEYGTRRVFGSYCVFKDKNESVHIKEAFGSWGYFIQESLLTLPILTFTPVIVLFIGYLLFLCIHMLSGQIVLFIFVLSEIFLTAFGLWAILYKDSIEISSFWRFVPLLPSGVVCLSAAIASLLLVYYYRSRIAAAIAIVDAASTCLSDIPLLFFLTIPWTILLAILSVFGVFALFCQLSLNAKASNFIDYLTFGVDAASAANMAVQIFLLLWILASLNALCEMVVAYIVGRWYFAPIKDSEVFQRGSVITEAIAVIFYYHIGTAAFGGLIIQIAVILKFLLLRRKGRHRFDYYQYPVQSCLFNCLQSLSRALLSFLKFISQMAFIHCGLLGRNFCKSSYSASSLAFRYGGGLIVLEYLGAVMKFFSEIVIIIGTCFIGFSLLQQPPFTSVKLTSVGIPLCWIALVAAIISGVLMRIWKTVIDSIWQCYMIDSEMKKYSSVSHLGYTPSPLCKLQLYQSNLARTIPIHYFP